MREGLGRMVAAKARLLLEHYLGLLADAHARAGQVGDALAMANRQGAKAYELRVATCFGRWLCRNGRAAEARALLAPIYTSFTEGFDTHDLIEAKALLEALG